MKERDLVGEKTPLSRSGLGEESVELKIYDRGERGGDKKWERGHVVEAAARRGRAAGPFAITASRIKGPRRRSSVLCGYTMAIGALTADPWSQIEGLALQKGWEKLTWTLIKSENEGKTAE